VTNSLFTRLNEATELAIGRVTSNTYLYRNLGQHVGKPGTQAVANDQNQGVDLSASAVSVYADFSPQIKAGYTTALVTLVAADFDAATTYSVTINSGTARTTTGQTTVGAAAAELVSEINDNEDETAVAVDFDGDGVAETVMIFSTTAFLVSAFSASGGGGSMVVSVDMDTSSEPDLYVWLRPKTPAGHWTTSPWGRAVSGSIALAPSNFPTMRINAARYSGIYFEFSAAPSTPSGTAAGAEPHAWMCFAEAVQEDSNT